VRRPALLLTGLAALVVVGAAAAKGPVQVCGAHRCGLLGSERAVAFPLAVPAGVELLPPARPAPYYVVRFRDLRGELGYWVPAAGVVRVRTQRDDSAAWFAPTRAQSRALRRATRGIAARRTPSGLDTVEVGYQRVEDASGWLSLYSVGTPVASAPDAGGWIRIAVYTKSLSSPWSDGTNRLAVSKAGAYLRRDGQLVAIPAGVADRIRARLPLG
jgi:hypothetical protein